MSSRGRNNLDSPMTWEENAERRITILEAKMDKLLDPETGIYSKLENIKFSLSRWAIAILVGVVGNLVVQFLYGKG